MGYIDKTANTRSGWQSFDSKGKKKHTFFWVPESYGLIGKSGKPEAGSLCYNCGKWNGSLLKRGEVKRFLQR